MRDYKLIISRRNLALVDLHKDDPSAPFIGLDHLVIWPDGLAIPHGFVLVQVTGNEISLTVE